MRKMCTTCEKFKRCEDKYHMFSGLEYCCLFQWKKDIREEQKETETEADKEKYCKGFF